MLNFASNEAYVLHHTPSNMVLQPLQALCLIRCKKWPVDGATTLFVFNFCGQAYKILYDRKLRLEIYLEFHGRVVNFDCKTL